MLAPARLAPRRSASRNRQPARSAPARFAPARSAPERFTPGRLIFPSVPALTGWRTAPVSLCRISITGRSSARRSFALRVAPRVVDRPQHFAEQALRRRDCAQLRAHLPQQARLELELQDAEGADLQVLLHQAHLFRSQLAVDVVVEPA